MRNISAKMRVDDRQKALDEFKQIHTQSNKEIAVQVLHEFYQNWEKAYPNLIILVRILLRLTATSLVLTNPLGLKPKAHGKSIATLII